MHTVKQRAINQTWLTFVDRHDVKFQEQVSEIKRKLLNNNVAELKAAEKTGESFHGRDRHESTLLSLSTRHWQHGQEKTK